MYIKKNKQKLITIYVSIIAILCIILSNMSFATNAILEKVKSAKLIDGVNEESYAEIVTNASDIIISNILSYRVILYDFFDSIIVSFPSKLSFWLYVIIIETMLENNKKSKAIIWISIALISSSFIIHL